MSEVQNSGRPSTSSDYREIALRLLDEGQRRSTVLGNNWMYAETGWSFLLLFSAQADDGDELPLTEAAAAAGVPPVQARRWMMVLADRGLVEEGAEQATDRYFKLSGRGVQLMRQYLATL